MATGSLRQLRGDLCLDEGAEGKRGHEDRIEPDSRRVLDLVAFERRNPDHNAGEAEDHSAERHPARGNHARDSSSGTLNHPVCFKCHLCFHIVTHAPLRESGTAPIHVRFTDTSTGSPTSWRGDFGELAWTAMKSPNVLFRRPGTYAVPLTATNSYGSSSVTKNLTVTWATPRARKDQAVSVVG